MTTLDVTSFLGREHRGPPLLRMPTELLHDIFTYLTPIEAANFRRVDKRIANIGVDYIVPVVSLVLNEDSFNKLEAIAQHPAIRKRVDSMVFDGNYLEYLDREHWEEAIYSLDMLLQQDAISCIGPTGNPDWSVYIAARQTWRSLPHHQCTKDQLDGAFAEYQQYLQKQSQLLRADGYLQRITQALENLPSLKNIVLDTDGHRNHVGRTELCRTQIGRTEVGLCTRKPWAVFGSGLCMKRATREDNYSASPAEVHAILNSVHRAGLRLENFTCTLLGWSYFSDGPRDYASYSGSLIHLKSMNLVIASMEDMDGFIDCLSTGRMLRFLTAAPYLESLRIGAHYTMNRWRNRQCDLEHLVGGFRWTLLARVTIVDVRAHENVLKGFLDRHSSTLRSVVLSNMSLSDGKWMSIFRMMRSELKLDALAIRGEFRDEDGIFYFDMFESVAETSFRSNVHHYILGATEDSQLIEAYLNENRFPI
ncbi:hypothetical protein JMJ35_009419 [Cladonia borealis]|uniref:F-box domain-containing protein n=1 Tax=Cladonia borealis TaxID=184061 RepID=A0AA39V6L4_9LECA|nr:hypothetical protein JMJ35_009419 [Cladonia borealis]